jgi:hypothetical protein
MKNIKTFNEKMSEKNYVITCLGYATAFTGKKMWYYKLTDGDKEYKIVIMGHLFLNSIWTEKNEFKNGNLSDEEEKNIRSLIEKIDKVDKELSNDEEDAFFTQHEIEPEPPEPDPVIINRTYSQDDVNDLLNVLDDEFDIRGNKYVKITQDVDPYYRYLIEPLVGYEVKVKTDGYHKNDGQLVEYTFTFKSPEGKKSYLVTEMCLMVGWNYCEDKFVIL